MSARPTRGDGSSRGARRSIARRARDWIRDADERATPGPARALLVALRVLFTTLRRLSDGVLHLRAAALSFHTVLAIVPALALLFAIGEAVGLYDVVVNTLLRPFLDETLGAPGHEPSEGVRSLRETVEALLSLVEHTSLAGLGIAGSVVLIFALVRVVRAAEDAFGVIFEVRGPPRSLRRRARAFAVTLAVTPLGLAYAVTAASAGHWLDALAWLGPARDLLVFVLPPILASLALLVMYRELPATEVRLGSALAGAIVGGLGWYLLQLLHVRFQVGLARWNAIYSGFGAFPVLLASIQASWLVVLSGALVTASVEHASIRGLFSPESRDHASLQRLALRIVVDLARLDRPTAAHRVAAHVQADVPSTRSALDALAAHGLVEAVAEGGARLYALKADARALRAFDVIDAIERDARRARRAEPDRDELGLVLDARRSAGSSSSENLTIDELSRRLEAEGASRERR